MDLQNMKNCINRSPLLLLIAFVVLLIWIILCTPYNNGPAIRSDGVGYYLWNHAFHTGNFGFCSYRDLMNSVGAMTLANGENICMNKYPPGVGLIQYLFTLPFVRYLQFDTSFSNFEHLYVLIISAGLLLGTVVLIYFNLKALNIGLRVIVLSLFAYIFGTGLFHYGTYDASFSHIYSAFGFSALIFITTQVVKKGFWPIHLFLIYMLLIFWIVLVRQTNIILVLYTLVLTCCRNKKSENTKTLIGLFFSVCMALSLQYFYNFWASGAFSFSSYGQESFTTFGGNFFNVLFSVERGLFTYYPIFLLTLLIGLYQRWSIDYLYLVSCILLYALLYGSWHSWYLGGGFGHRGFVELAPLGCLVYAKFLNNNSRIIRTNLIAVSFICIYITLSIMTAYWLGSFPFSGGTWLMIKDAIFLKHFFSFM
jgi:hypothetical protein